MVNNLSAVAKWPVYDRGKYSSGVKENLMVEVHVHSFKTLQND